MQSRDSAPILQMLQSIDGRLERINDRIENLEEKVGEIASTDGATSVRITNLEAADVATKKDMAEVKRLLKLVAIILFLAVSGHLGAASALAKGLFGVG